ncbi:hypothetical protein C8J57DRAFT_1227180 [Mycena rebaudengoi]|nr:hypothetical protein C8J57DRAFT_1227180 [Mycena rebaudengoi]
MSFSIIAIHGAGRTVQRRTAHPSLRWQRRRDRDDDGGQIVPPRRAAGGRARGGVFQAPQMHAAREGRVEGRLLDKEEGAKHAQHRNGQLANGVPGRHSASTRHAEARGGQRLAVNIGTAVMRERGSGRAAKPQRQPTHRGRDIASRTPAHPEGRDILCSHLKTRRYLPRTGKRHRAPEPPFPNTKAKKKKEQTTHARQARHLCRALGRPPLRRHRPDAPRISRRRKNPAPENNPTPKKERKKPKTHLAPTPRLPTRPTASTSSLCPRLEHTPTSRVARPPLVRARQGRDRQEQPPLLLTRGAPYERAFLLEGYDAADDVLRFDDAVECHEPPPPRELLLEKLESGCVGECHCARLEHWWEW